MHTSSPKKLPDIFVQHYEELCSCFSCRWVRETKCSFLMSKTGEPYSVANPTHDRVPHNERQRLLTHVPKKKFQIMYIYAMQLEDKSWGWVVVLPLPLIPFLLTDEKYSEIDRFARHPQDGWFGLKANGQRVNIDQEMVPPLYNPFYQYYGYDPRCSPYRLYQPPTEESISDNEAKSSPNDQTNSSSQNPTAASSSSESKASSSSEDQKDQTASSAGNNTKSSCEDHTPPSSKVHATSTSANPAGPATEELTSPSAEVQTNMSLEAQATSSKPPADKSTSDQDEWVVIDPRCANPPEESGPCNDKCGHPQHNGKYYGLRCGHHQTNWRNTTIFVGGLDARITQQDLHHWFKGFGELMHVRKKREATCGFVQYPGRKEAEMAMSQMQGYPIFGARLRLSWGNPEQKMDPKYREYHVQSAWKAHRYEDFKVRMDRGEAVRENDPDSLLDQFFYDAWSSQLEIDNMS